jgi:hypothetical protein
MLSRFSSALFLVCAARIPAAAQVSVQVVFQNGDRLSGDLKKADTQTIEIHPAATSLGDSVKIQWTADSVVELQLRTKRGSAPGCLYPPPRSSGVASSPLCFQTAVATRTTGTTPSLAISAGTAAPRVYASLDSNAPEPPKAISLWTLNLGAPESIVQGTQSQQTFGGFLNNEVFFGNRDHFTLAVAGTHQHTVPLHKTPSHVDVFDSLMQLSHSYQNGFGVYATGEWFFNSSLGLAAERSGGAGVILPALSLKSHPTGGQTPREFFAKTWTDMRYFNERLYDATKLDLVGAVVHGEVNFYPSSGKWSLTSGFAYKPMFNDRRAWQATGGVSLNLVIDKHACFSITPAEDTYVNNSPKGYRRNYLKSSVGLKLVSDSKNNGCS